MEYLVVIAKTLGYIALISAVYRAIEDYACLPLEGASGIERCGCSADQQVRMSLIFNTRGSMIACKRSCGGPTTFKVTL